MKLKGFLRTGLLPVLLLILPVYYSYAQEEIPMIEKNDIKLLRTLGKQTYNDSSLWGYIDGGADLYLEYGFTKMITQTLIFKGFVIRVEAFQMKDETAAFGIYSASHLNCRGGNDKCRYYCMNSQQVQFLAGRLYYNISSPKVNPGTTEACEYIASILLSKLKVQNDYIIPPIFTKGIFEPKQADIKLIRGRLGFENAFPDWQDKFEGYNKPEIVLVPFDFPDGTLTASTLKFSSGADLDKFITEQKLQPLKKKQYSAGEGKYRRFLIKTGDKTAYFQESWGRSESIDKTWSDAMEQVIKFIREE